MWKLEINFSVEAIYSIFTLHYKPRNSTSSVKIFKLFLLFFLVHCLFSPSRLLAQINSDDSGFKDYYPISKRPYLSGGIGNNPYERIIFDAKPVVYYGIYNDIREALSKDTIVPGDAVYINLQPHLRLYNENSKPVKTPSYKAFLGWQRILSTRNNNFFTAALESGHYSNGQTGAAFSTAFEDGTEGGNAAYDRITDDTNLAEILNRDNGNFSTNLTRLSLNYRINRFDSLAKPTKIHSFTLTYQLYHDKFLGLFSFGGYNPNDIDLYGRHRLELTYGYTGYLKKARYSIEQEVYLHFGRHPSADFYRSETRGLFYPWDNDFGFFAEFSFGFDDYNYRFVDSYPRLSFGMTWDWFTPFVVKKKRP